MTHVNKNVFSISTEKSFNTYITKDNVEINIGDELTIGTNSDAEKFKNIFEGNTKNRKLESCKNLESKYANTTVIVKGTQ